MITIWVSPTTMKIVITIRWRGMSIHLSISQANIVQGNKPSKHIVILMLNKGFNHKYTHGMCIRRRTRGEVLEDL